jgi:hypothetical protein
MIHMVLLHAESSFCTFWVGMASMRHCPLSHGISESGTSSIPTSATSFPHHIFASNFSHRFRLIHRYLIRFAIRYLRKNVRPARPKCFQLDSLMGTESMGERPPSLDNARLVGNTTSWTCTAEDHAIYLSRRRLRHHRGDLGRKSTARARKGPSQHWEAGRQD